MFCIADCYKLSTIEMKFNKIILILLAIGFVACGQENRLEADSELRKDIEETVTSGQKFLDIEKLTDFQWDSLIILTPYVNYHKIEDQYHINLSAVKHSDIQLRDDISQLIFFRDSEPVRMVEYPRFPGDFSNNNVEFIKRDSAIFDIVETREKTLAGNNRIELIKR